jgi:hypothetical protein
MDAQTNNNTKVSPQLAKLKWDDKVIDKLKVKIRATIPFDVAGNLKGMHLRLSLKGNKTFYLIGKVKGTKKHSS